MKFKFFIGMYIIFMLVLYLKKNTSIFFYLSRKFNRYLGTLSKQISNAKTEKRKLVF